MRIELNHKEYISELYPPDLIKCNYCALTFLPASYCRKFCRKGLIFRTTGIAPSIFYL